MRYQSPGKHRDVASFRAHLEAVGAALGRPGLVGCDDEIEPAPRGPLARPLEVDGLRIGNRFCIQPMEGWDGTEDGRPGPLTLRRWNHFGRSGAKLVWGGEAFAVQPDGRANPNQLCAGGADIEHDLVTLYSEVCRGHAAAGLAPDELVLGLQLTHSGRFSRPTSAGPAPKRAWFHPTLDARQGLGSDPAPLTDGELEGIGEAYAALARKAQAAGFDFVDVKCCHGYLLHELLGARERPGPYGGALENRMRLVLRIVDAISSAAPGLRIACRLSAGDLATFGPEGPERVGAPQDRAPGEPPRSGFGVHPTDPARFDLDEAQVLLTELRSRGVQLVNVSLGSPYTCPHLQRPAAYPPVDGYAPPEDPLQSVVRHILAVADLRAALPEMVFVLSGTSYLQEWLPHVAQHALRSGLVDSIGLGRMVLSYPELPLDVLAGRTLDRRRLCRTFSDCTNAPRQGLVSGCYPLDPHYRALPDYATLQASKRAARSS